MILVKTLYEGLGRMNSKTKTDLLRKFSQLSSDVQLNEGAAFVVLPIEQMFETLLDVIEAQDRALEKCSRGYSVFDFKTGAVAYKEYPETIEVRETRAEVAQKLGRLCE